MPFRIKSTSELARKQIYQKGNYLVAPVKETGQERKKIKVLDDNFRYKAYLKNQEWFDDSLRNVWSDKYIGLNTETGFKILEYQNPAYSAAKALGKDPRLYGNAWTVQLAGCDYACSYCYVPYKINRNISTKKGTLFSATEIVDRFLQTRLTSSIPLNVLRISGGNPSIVPEIIIEIVNEIQKRDLNDIYIWIDSNLSNPKYMINCGNHFKEAIKSSIVGIVGCFKGLCGSDFELLTGCSAKDYNKQFDTAQYLLDTGADFFLYLPALTYKENFESTMVAFANELIKIHKNLPLRTEILQIFDYPASIENRSFWANKNRPFPDDHQIKFHQLWYEKILTSMYPPENLNKLCCQIDLL